MKAGAGTGVDGFDADSLGCGAALDDAPTLLLLPLLLGVASSTAARLGQ